MTERNGSNRSVLKLNVIGKIVLAVKFMSNGHVVLSVEFV